MKNTKNIIGCFMASIAFLSCTEDDSIDLGNCFTGSWVTEVQGEYAAWANALSLNSTDPTTVNCQKQVTAATNYLDALERIKECVPSAALADFDLSIDDLRSELSNEICE